MYKQMQKYQSYRKLKLEFYVNLKGQCVPKSTIDILFLLPVVLFINLDCFSVSCLVLEISTIKISALLPP